MVFVVQLVRTSDCGSEGRRFDPDQTPKNKCSRFKKALGKTTYSQ